MISSVVLFSETLQCKLIYPKGDVITANESPSRELLSVQFLQLDSRIQDNMNLIDSFNSMIHILMQIQFLFVINNQIKMHRIE